jgi:HEPN domain-containing protein
MERHEVWLDRAKSALRLAKAQVYPPVLYEDLCFQAQQAAEKALKGVLIYYQEEPEFTHNIDRILKALEKHTDIPYDVQKATKLTNYAVFTRYPGTYDDLTKENYQESIALATACLNWAEQKMNRPSLAPQALSSPCPPQGAPHSKCSWQRVLQERVRVAFAPCTRLPPPALAVQPPKQV